MSRSTNVYVAMSLGVAALWVALRTEPGMRVVTAADLALLDVISSVRSSPLDVVMRAGRALGSDAVVRVLAWPTLAALVVLRRFHRLVVLVAVTVSVVVVNASMADAIGRLRPVRPDILGPWEGYAHPSMPVATLGLTVVGALYTLVPAGTWRRRLVVPGLGLVAFLGLARLYLAVDHPTDVLVGAITGIALPVAAFRLLAPDEVATISYHRGRPAHLDVTGRRTEAIAIALRRQMGLRLSHVEAFGLHGSAGSTPIRITVTEADGEATRRFGKLYANVHLRSDRWYKLARTVMYGRLEDERSFNSVRRLVEHEDHMLRFATDAGLPAPRPLGFVEITPEREYLLVTEFLEGAEPLRADLVDDAVIDDGLGVVRRMWTAGFAHRDIKPSNLFVRDGRVLLIDLAFAAIRPSPWRQAVDLANTMMTLSLFSTPERVYERAVLAFSPDEIGEAFAASRGATVPTELRTLLKRDGRDVASVLRSLAPERPPVSIQRWTLRRLGVTAAVVASALVAGALFFDYLAVAGLR